LYPVVNLTPNANSREGFRDPLLPPTMIGFYNRSYIGENDAANPLISPVFADLSGLLSLLLHVGEDEVLLD
jgi:epsilon-lactone hydrolase